MSEETPKQHGLSPEREAEASHYFAKEQLLTKQQETNARQLEKINQKLHDNPSYEYGTEAHHSLIALQKELYRQREELPEKRDANTWRAHQHKEQHLLGYIEQARQDAAAEGVEIVHGTEE